MSVFPPDRAVLTLFWRGNRSRTHGDRPLSQSLTPPAPDPTAGAAPDAAQPVRVTITGGGGAYTVYAGDEPDEGGGDMSDEDAGAMGDDAAPAPQGQPADSVGAVLKAVMDILQAGSSGGAAGSPDDQFAAGFGGAAPSVGAGR